MNDFPEQRVIPRSAVRRVAAPVVVECSSSSSVQSATMTVIPLMDGDRVEGFEVRCQCGAAVVVECLYEEQPS